MPAPLLSWSLGEKDLHWEALRAVAVVPFASWFPALGCGGSCTLSVGVTMALQATLAFCEFMLQDLFFFFKKVTITKDNNQLFWLLCS